MLQQVMMVVGVRSTITWTNVVNATVQGNNDLLSTNNAFSSGASSVQSIGSSGGQITFPVAGTGALGARVTGLSLTDPDTGFASILFAIDQFNNRTFVFESGNNRGEFANVVLGDTYKIMVSAAGAVTYYINNGLIYTSGLTATFPLIVDVSIQDNNRLLPAPTMT